MKTKSHKIHSPRSSSQGYSPISIIGIAVTVFVVALFFSTTTIACGNIKIAIKLYNKPTAGVSNKVRALKMLSCHVHRGYYRNSKSDHEILRMLHASAKSVHLAKYVGKILKTYRCLPCIKRDSIKLTKLIKKFSPDNCPTSTQMKNYYLINASMAKFYKKPDSTSKTRFSLGRFYIVEKISQPNSKWIEVKSWGNEKGFVLSSKLKRLDVGQY